eukprot:m.618336 g.618336  ORF g.618336 m.618336 type:complete len:289 (+) comp22527_c2_seq5:910-1776(+)
MEGIVRRSDRVERREQGGESARRLWAVQQRRCACLWLNCRCCRRHPRAAEAPGGDDHGEPRGRPAPPLALTVCRQRRHRRRPHPQLAVAQQKQPHYTGLRFLEDSYAVLKLQLSDFAISGFAPGATGEGTGDAPTIRFDAEQGYYYSIGGGWITNGPARSRNLTAGSWEVSQYAPMAVPDARAVAAGLPPADKNAGLNKNFYQEIWSPQILPPSEETELQGWLDNTSVWNWGATDVDVCCGDGKAPSYILNTLSRQGAPSGVTEHTVTFARLGRVNMSLNEWFRSYFD